VREKELNLHLNQMMGRFQSLSNHMADVQFEEEVVTKGCGISIVYENPPDEIMDVLEKQYGKDRY
jgi:hypothetical protein